MPAVAEPPVEPSGAPVAPSTIQKASKMGDIFRAKNSDEPTKPVVPDPAVVEPNKPDPKSAVKVDEPKTTKELNFKKLNDEFDNFRKSATTKQQELEAALAQKEASLTEEIKSERTKREEYEKIIKTVALERDPKFKEAFDRKIDSAAATVKEAVGAENADKVAKILKLPPSEWRDEQIEAMAEGLSDFKRSRLTAAYNALGEVQRARETELSNAEQNVELLEQFRQQEAAKNGQQKRQFQENIFQAELAKFSQVIPDFKEIDGNKEHNELVSKTRQEAKDWLSAELDDGDRARMALWAAKGRNSLQTDALKDSLIAKLQEQVQQLSAAQPGMRTTASGAPKNKIPTAQDRVAKYQHAMEHGVPEKQAA